MASDARTVSELGEAGLIERILGRAGLPPQGETWGGDDAAVLRARDERLIYTTDVLVEGVDFDFSYCLGSDVGWKALAASASDIAAMGGRPHHALAGLSLPPETLTSVVDGLLEGLIDAAQRWGVGLVGGDISMARDVSLYVAMLGTPAGEKVLHRFGAKPGEAICVTGSLGGAAGGLLALRRSMAGPGPTEGRALSPDLADAVTRLAARQLRPQARLEEAGRLAELDVSAMIDVSDGLAVDLYQVVSASRTGCDVDPASIPVDPDLQALEGAVTDERIDPLGLAITGGEDFELLFTIVASQVGAAVRALEGTGTQVTRIGTVTRGERRIGSSDLQDYRESSWDHLLGR